MGIKSKASKGSKGSDKSKKGTKSSKDSVDSKSQKVGKRDEQDAVEETEDSSDSSDSDSSDSDSSSSSDSSDSDSSDSDSSDSDSSDSDSSDSDSSDGDSSDGDSSDSDSSDSDSSDSDSSDSDSSDSDSSDSEDAKDADTKSVPSATPQIDEEAESSEEEDLMPKFSAPEATNTTENLRSLFNQAQADETQKGFGFAVESDDIDEDHELVAEEERQKLLEQIKAKQAEENVYIERRRAHKKKVGLFWAHFDSPFLQAQTQLSKIGTVGQKITLPGEENAEENGTKAAEDSDEDAYEKWFWSVRGEISRECRKRRREVTKHVKKKNVKVYV